MGKANDAFGARGILETSGGAAVIYRLDSLEKSGHGTVSRLPFSIKVLLEALLRNCDGTLVTKEDVTSLAQRSGNAGRIGMPPSGCSARIACRPPAPRSSVSASRREPRSAPWTGARNRSRRACSYSPRRPRSTARNV